jgi:hypothetical protein
MLMGGRTRLKREEKNALTIRCYPSLMNENPEIFPRAKCEFSGREKVLERPKA